MVLNNFYFEQIFLQYIYGTSKDKLQLRINNVFNLQIYKCLNNTKINKEDMNSKVTYIALSLFACKQISG